MPKKATARTKIIDALPQVLRKPLKGSHLEDLTFADLATVGKQLSKARQKDPAKFEGNMPGCASCFCWP